MLENHSNLHRAEIPLEWIEIAARMESERKFKVDLTDMGYTVNEGQEFWIKDKQYMWNMRFKLMPFASQSIVIDKASCVVISVHKEWESMIFEVPVNFNDFVTETRKFLRQLLTNAINSLDNSTYTVQSILTTMC